MTDLRKAAEMALNALEFSLPAIEDFGSKEQLTDCHRAIMALYKSLAQPEPQVCCGDYEKCIKACTARGRWLANQQMTRLKQEKGQFVGGVPSVSQQREWVGLSEHEIWECQKPGLSDDVYKAIEAKLKEKNT